MNRGKKYTLERLIEEHSLNPIESKMTQLGLEGFIKNLEGSEVLEEEQGYILFKYNTIKMVLMSDEEHNRMRVIAPITSYSNLAPKIKDSLMSSNFHHALDARYSVSQNTLYGAFLHPLSSLTKEDLLSAVNQVHSLVKNFGKTYSSAQIEFTNKK